MSDENAFYGKLLDSANSRVNCQSLTELIENTFKGILLNETAAQRMYAVATFVRAMASINKEVAEKLGEDLASNLAYLARIATRGGDEPDGFAVLSDDGILNSFGFQVFAHKDDGRTVELRPGKIRHGKYIYNGGLIFHGPGSGQTWQVNVGDVHYWSLHS